MDLADMWDPIASSGTDCTVTAWKHSVGIMVTWKRGES
jgi:hypothetical protein